MSAIVPPPRWTAFVSADGAQCLRCVVPTHGDAREVSRGRYMCNMSRDYLFQIIDDLILTDPESEAVFARCIQFRDSPRIMRRGRIASTIWKFLLNSHLVADV
jgi:hypothetical protein